MKISLISLTALSVSHARSRFGDGRIAGPTMTLVFLVLTCFFLTQNATAQTKPSISPIDRTRLAEAFRLGDWIGNRIWPSEACECGPDTKPFAVLLVTPEYEFLVRHPEPSKDFISIGYDELLNDNVYYRKRVFSSSFLATFPAVSGSMVSTIVVGQAENTSARTSTPWVITLLHEHFHQLQDSQPNFYADVNALKLSRGDQTGMWMLNYAFPYDRKDVQDHFEAMSKLLAAAVQSPKDERATKVREYLESRRKFQSLVSPDDFKYFAFQLWKEGIARYTEYHAVKMAAAEYRASPEFSALKDYRPFADVAQATRDQIFRELMTQKLGESKREVVYAYGAAEGLLLDEINPRWRERYFAEKFDLGKLFP